MQTLKQVTGTNSSPSTWREGTDVIVGESRGSQTIERYVDPNSTTNASGTVMPDYAAATTGSITTTSPTPLSQFYKFRVVSNRQFAP